MKFSLPESQSCPGVQLGMVCRLWWWGTWCWCSSHRSQGMKLGSQTLWDVLLQGAAYQLSCLHQTPTQAISLQYCSLLHYLLHSRNAAGWPPFFQLSSSYLLAQRTPQHHDSLQDEWWNINVEDYLKTHCDHFWHISCSNGLSVLFGSNPVPLSRYSTWCTSS